MIKHMTFRRLAATLAIASGLLLSVHASAQDRPPLSLALVDIQELSRLTKAVQEVQKEIQAHEKKMQAEYIADQRRLQAAFNQLQKDRPNITGAQYDERYQDLNRQAVEAQRTLQVRRNQLGEAFRKAQEEFQKQVVEVVQAIAVEEGYNLVLNEGTVIHISPQFDITKKVAERINAKLKKIEFEFPPKEEDTTRKPAPPVPPRNP